MVKKLLYLFVILMAIQATTLGWYDWSQEYDRCYIAGVNPDQHLEPDDIDDHPDQVDANLPFTLRVYTEKGSGGFDIQKIKVQYRLESESTWTDIEPTYEDTGSNFEFGWQQEWFGRAPEYTLTSDDVSPGDTVLIRIHIANLDEGWQNASLDEDTTEDGTNGWEDPWVVSFVIGDNTRPPQPEDGEL